MAEGWKQIVTNSRERAISSDQNRAQKVVHADIAELLRYWLDVTGNDDLDAGGVIAEPASVETPLRGEIINGLLARPQAASQNVFIDPGVVMLMAPDAAPDESNYKYVHDAGTTTPGALVIAAGAVGTRIDVVECRMNPVDITATESRDVFNPVTGLFAAAVVTKERRGRLEYRVRQGVAGGGYPGAALGWLPLMIASVPAAALTNDDCTFWDVRPLLNDRAYSMFNLSNSRSTYNDGIVLATEAGAPGELRMSGAAEIIHSGRRAGGRIRRGSPGADPDYVDLLHADNTAVGAVFGTSAPYYVYLMFPFGLPRWARYTAAPSLVPRSPRGIPIVTGVAPLVSGAPSAALTFPVAFGFAAATSAVGALYAVGLTTSINARSAFVSGLNGQFHFLSLRQVAPITTNGIETTTDLIAGTDYPANAKALLVTIAVTNTAGAPEYTNMRLRVQHPTGPTDVHLSRPVNFVGGTGTGTQSIVQAWIPTVPFFPGAPPSPTMRVRLTYTTGATVAAGGFLEIAGCAI